MDESSAGEVWNAMFGPKPRPECISKGCTEPVVIDMAEPNRDGTGVEYVGSACAEHGEGYLLFVEWLAAIPEVPEPAL